MNTEKPANSWALARVGTLNVLVFAAAFVAMMSVAAAKKFGVVDYDTAKRVAGCMIGVILMVTGNVFPKLVLPIREQLRLGARRVKSDRVAGWAFVLSGLAMIGVWVFVPIHAASLTAASVGLVGFAVACVSWLRFRRTSICLIESGTSFSESDLAESRATRAAAFHVLQAVFWVCVMFFVDSLWGDAAAQWVVFGFFIGILFFALPMSSSTAPYVS